MSWNYRVIKSIEESGEAVFAIHEVYYDQNHTPHSCTVDPIALQSESLEDLKLELEQIKKAFDSPVLEMLYFDNLSQESNTGDT